MIDPLSQLLELVEARCVITGRLRAGGDWAIRFSPDAQVKLDVVTHGTCWLLVDDSAPRRLAGGDAVVLNGLRAAAVLCSEPGAGPIVDADPSAVSEDGIHRVGEGDEVEVIGGHVELDPAAAELFVSALPAVTHVVAARAESSEMRRLLERVVHETAGARPGSAFVADQYAQLLLVEVLRAGLAPDATTFPGWLALLADRELRPAVALMHAEPDRAWGLAELAAASGMSRSHFAQRFRRAAGQPPLTYLTHWRIRLAERELRRSDVTVGALAQRLGYATESSFSHAFARVAGQSPSDYRRTSAQRGNGGTAGAAATTATAPSA